MKEVFKRHCVLIIAAILVLTAALAADARGCGGGGSCCGGSQEHEHSTGPVGRSHGHEEGSAPTRTIRIQVKDGRFQPAEVHATAGSDVRLVFRRLDTGGCATHVQMPTLGVAARPLPVGRDVTVDLLSVRRGRHPFTCPMNMIRGTLIVHS